MIFSNISGRLRLRTQRHIPFDYAQGRLSTALRSERQGIEMASVQQGIPGVGSFRRGLSRALSQRGRWFYRRRIAASCALPDAAGRWADHLCVLFATEAFGEFGQVLQDGVGAVLVGGVGVGLGLRA